MIIKTLFYRVAGMVTMNKQSIFYGLIFLFLATMGQEAFAMKGFSQKASNYFRIGMKGLNYAGVIGLPTYIISKIDIIKKEIKEIDKTPTLIQSSENLASSSIAETEKYILNVLHTAYPELKNTRIKVVNLPCKAWELAHIMVRIILRHLVLIKI